MSARPFSYSLVALLIAGSVQAATVDLRILKPAICTAI